MGGSHMATDLRLVVMFLLSLMSTVAVSTTAHYGSSTTALLLATTTGYLLSQDLFLVPNTFSTLLGRRNTHTVKWKPILYHFLLSLIKGCSLVITSLLLVYFSSTAGDRSRRTAGRVLGICVLVLAVLLRTGTAAQSTYLLGLVRNPLHPWRSEDVQRFKSWRRKLSYCSFPGRLVLTYVSPLLMLAYVALEVDVDAPHQWLRAITVARLLRKVWQNTWSAHCELFIVSLLQLVLPESHASHWRELGVGFQALVVGLCLEVFHEFFLKLRFAFTLFIEFILKDGKKIKRWLYILIIAGSPILIPASLVAIFLSSIISAPLLPLFTLPVFLISFPRTLRFWPSLTDYGSSYNKCKDSTYYQHDVPLVNKAMDQVVLNGSVSGCPGDFYLLRCQDRILIATVLEQGHGYYTLNIRGLEIQETSCHTVEASRIDDIFSSAYNPSSPTSLGFWLNCHLLNTLQPVDSAVVCTYSDARSVLTGIIDQPSVLRRFSTNLLKCIVWVLYHHAVSIQWREGGRETEKECGGKEVKWRRRNRVAPVVVVAEPSQSQVVHSLPHQQLNTAGELVNEKRDCDSFSWTSIESLAEDGTSSPQHGMSGLIPVDIPVARDCLSSAKRAHPVKVDHSSRLLPNEWLDFPFSDSQLATLLPSFPSDWLTFISTGTNPLPDCGHTLFEKLCLACFTVVDVPQSSLGSVQTKPFHIHSGFCGEFPYSAHRDWLTRTNQALYQLILKAYRYAVKLLCDETVLGEAHTLSELSDYLQCYQTDHHIGSEEEPEWDQAILSNIPNLFSVGKSQDTDAYTAHVLTLQDEVVHVGRLNRAAVHSVWSDLALELLYLTNDDEERYSIQAHPSLLRNITIQAADPPLGYAVYSSGITRCPHIA